MATIAFQMTSTPLTGTKIFTGTDADMQALLDWAAKVHNGIIQELFNPTRLAGFVPTNAQIGVGLATATMNSWKAEVQQFQQSPPTLPQQITFT